MRDDFLILSDFTSGGLRATGAFPSAGTAATAITASLASGYAGLRKDISVLYTDIGTRYLIAIIISSAIAMVQLLVVFPGISVPIAVFAVILRAEYRSLSSRCCYGQASGVPWMLRAMEIANAIQQNLDAAKMELHQVPRGAFDGDIDTVPYESLESPP